MPTGRSGEGPAAGGAWSRRTFLKASAIAAAGFVGLGAVIAGLGRSVGTPPTSLGRSAVPSGLDGAEDTLAPAAAASAAAARRRQYLSRPDLSSTPIAIGTAASGIAPGLILLSPNNGLAPDGLLIVDDAGRPVWIRPSAPGIQAANLAVISYRNEPVLTWWEGTLNGGNGSGEFVVMDGSYMEVLRVGAGGGHPADLHEFLITPTGTTLAFWGSALAVDVARNATPAPWEVWDDVILETDIATGSVLFEWHSSDHIDVAESVVGAPTGANAAYDAVHLNSIDIDTDGHLLVSARNTSCVYKIDRHRGAILWRLGGKRSDFAFGDGATFSWQHDVRRQADGSVVIFDDGTAPAQSRAIVLAIDEMAKTATLIRAYDHPHALNAQSQGSARYLPNGNMFVGWGSTPYLSEFSHDGTLLFDASFPDAVQSYRSLRTPWVGRPTARPALVVDATPEGTPAAYVSWNGATEVETWELLAGDTAATLTAVSRTARSGFETVIPMETPARFIAARALDAAGAFLGISSVVAREI